MRLMIATGRAQSDLRSCLALARDWLLIFGSIFIATRAGVWWITVASVVWIGLVQFAIGEALLHEASHYNLFRRSRRVNELWVPRIHHRFPVVPFHQLPSAHRALGPLGEEQHDVTGGWWGVWRQISRSAEPAPEQWTAFWPRDIERSRRTD
jgi:fatty acid desaturase